LWRQNGTWVILIGEVFSIALFFGDMRNDLVGRSRAQALHIVLVDCAAAWLWNNRG